MADNNGPSKHCVQQLSVTVLNRPVPSQCKSKIKNRDQPPIVARPPRSEHGGRRALPSPPRAAQARAPTTAPTTQPSLPPRASRRPQKSDAFYAAGRPIFNLQRGTRPVRTNGEPPDWPAPSAAFPPTNPVPRSPSRSPI